MLKEIHIQCNLHDITCCKLIIVAINLHVYWIERNSNTSINGMRQVIQKKAIFGLHKLASYKHKLMQ